MEYNENLDRIKAGAILLMYHDEGSTKGFRPAAHVPLFYCLKYSSIPFVTHCVTFSINFLHKLILSVQGFQDHLGRHFSHSKQCQGGAVRPPAPLFPVLQSVNADTDHVGELCLGLVEFGPDLFDLRRAEFEDPARL